MALSFGEKLRYLREEKQLNQTDLGKKLGMTQRKLSYIECGKCEPNIDDLRAICKFFKISADFMLDIPNNFKYLK